MTASDTAPPPPWLADAWTAADAARHLGYPLPAAEMLMDRVVMRGLATRVTCGRTTVYVPNSMSIHESEDQR